MKYLKLFEKYIDDAIKIEKESDDIGRKMAKKNKEISNKLDSYNILIVDAFDDLSEKDGDYKKIKLNVYNEKLDKKLVELIKLIGGFQLKLITDSKEYILTLEYQNIKLIAAILDALVEKFPEYFEGKSMGFFDLKTND